MRKVHEPDFDRPDDDLRFFTELPKPELHLHLDGSLEPTLALELARTGVTANAICPGYCLTDLVKGQLRDTAKARGMAEDEVIEKVMLADQPTRRFVDTDDVGALAVHLCGPHSSSITGALLAIDGGWTAR